MTERTLDQLQAEIDSEELKKGEIQKTIDGLKAQLRAKLDTAAQTLGLVVVESVPGSKPKAKKASGGSTTPKPDVVSFLNTTLADSPLNEEQIRAAYKKAYPNSRLFLGKYVTDKVVKKSKDGMYTLA